MERRHERLAEDAVLQLRAALRRWHAASGRRLAFRDTRDPYAVLVAETMLQQTQVARIERAWPAFLEAFPDPASLAAASPDRVLRSWAGLGYNRRALALQRAAAAIVTHHGGVVPGDVAMLDALPGVGPYTARAVAAIAFGVPVAAVDTNVRRVTGRVFAAHGHHRDPGAAASAAAVQALADRFVDPHRPGEWTHAVMDLGATVCRPLPRCASCPLATWCAYARAASDGAMRAAGPASSGTSRPAPGPRRGRVAPAVPFESTSRWLRGRIVERLRTVPSGSWLVLESTIGVHPPAAVRAALVGLERDGLVERGPLGVRLPVSSAG